jgi:hypothetical protein
VRSHHTAGEGRRGPACWSDWFGVLCLPRMLLHTRDHAQVCVQALARRCQPSPGTSTPAVLSLPATTSHN